MKPWIMLIPCLLAGSLSHTEPRLCVLHERGEWASSMTGSILYLSDKRFPRSMADMRCRVHETSRIEVVSLPGDVEPHPGRSAHER